MCRPGATLMMFALIAVSTVVPSTPAMADATTPTLMFGAYAAQRSAPDLQTAVQRMETQFGRPLALVRVFDLWDTQFPDPYTTWLRDSGHTIVLSVKSNRANGGRVLWRDIANAAPGSTLYNNMVSWADRLRDFGVPIYFCFNHEPEASASSSNGTSSEFIAAWRKFVTIIRAEGASNVHFTWIMTDYAFWRTDSGRAALWYPGDAYVDYAGADAYNWYNCRRGISNPWWSLEWIAAHLRDWGLAHPSVWLMLTEFASHEDPNTPGRKASWFADAEAFFKKPGWEQFKAIIYFNNAVPSTCNFWVDSSASALAALKTLVTDPFYGAVQDQGPGDTVPPSVPGAPTGSSSTSSSIDLTWGASTDDVAQTLTYRIYRDGGSTAVGTVISASTTTVGFTDTGLSPGSTHTYEVTANDGPNTSARSPASDPITVLVGTSPIFADDFSSGTLSNWTTVSRLSIDQTAGAPQPPSVRGAPVAQTAFAARDLGQTYSNACLSERVNLLSGSSVVLMRLRTAANGPVSRVFLSGGVLWAKSDVSGAQRSSGVALGSGWHLIELCSTIGPTAPIDVYRDGVQIVSGFTSSTGTTPIGRIEIGDANVGTWTANLDDVILDQQVG